MLADATLSCGDFGGDLRFCFCFLIKFKNALRLKLLFCGFTLCGEGVLVEPTLVRRDDLPELQFMGELGGGGDFGEASKLDDATTSAACAASADTTVCVWLFCGM